MKKTKKKGVVIYSNSIPTVLEMAMAEVLKGGKAEAREVLQTMINKPVG